MWKFRASFLLNIILIFIFISHSHQGLSRSQIVGGKSASKGNFPYMVSIEHLGLHWCGGSIISPYFILTAAHCSIGTPFSIRASELKVRANSIDREHGGQTRRVAKIIEHPLYNQNGKLENDVALYKLTQPFKLDGRINKINLVESHYEVPKKLPGMICGWGYTDSSLSSDLPKTLQFAIVQIFPKEDCMKYYDAVNIVISDTVFCAGLLSGTIDACQSDSGGPLTIGTGSKLRLLGIVSGGRRCGEENVPGIYTDIRLVRQWIDETIKAEN